MLGESDELDIGTLSTGGGMLELVSLDVFPIKVTGDHWFPFIKNPVSLPVDECECQMLTKNNEQLLVITRYQSQSPALPDGEWTRECAPILPVQAFTSYKMPFTNYKEALTCASSQGLSAGELGIRYEMARSGKSRDEVLSMMSHIMDVMHASVLDSTHRRGGKVFDFYPYKATEMTKNSENLPDPLKAIGKISINASAVFAHTLSVGLVVAAPTGFLRYSAFCRCGIGNRSMAATNAVSAATMILSGYAAYIPLDETIQVMMDVGRKMPACHRCTGGGLNLSPTGRLLNEASARYIQTL